MYVCAGYTQLDATLNCYLRPDRFDSLPAEPVLHKQGAEAFLVSHVQGTLKDIPGIEKIRSLSSFRCAIIIIFWSRPHSFLFLFVFVWSVKLFDCFLFPS